MIILGIHGGFTTGVQDASACLVKDGIVLGAIQEERLCRVKFSPGRLPFLAIGKVLKICNIAIEEVDYVAFHGVNWGKGTKTALEGFFVTLPQVLIMR